MQKKCLVRCCVDPSLPSYSWPHSEYRRFRRAPSVYPLQTFLMSNFETFLFSESSEVVEGPRAPLELSCKFYSGTSRELSSPRSIIAGRRFLHICDPPPPQSMLYDDLYPGQAMRRISISSRRTSVVAGCDFSIGLTRWRFLR